MKKEVVWEKKRILSLLVQIILCVGLNLLGHAVAKGFRLPFWFDSIGTVVMAATSGPIPGAVVGGLTNGFLSMLGREYLAYALVNILVGIVVGISYPDDLTDYFQIVSTAAMTALVVILVSSLLNVMFYDGYCGNLWGDALYDMLEQGGSSKFSCVLLSEGFVDFPDKTLTLLFASGLIRWLDWVKRKLGRKKDEEILDNN